MQWAALDPLPPKPSRLGRPRWCTKRQLITVIRWRVRCTVARQSRDMRFLTGGGGDNAQFILVWGVQVSGLAGGRPRLCPDQGLADVHRGSTGSIVAFDPEAHKQRHAVECGTKRHRAVALATVTRRFPLMQVERSEV